MTYDHRLTQGSFTRTRPDDTVPKFTCLITYSQIVRGMQYTMRYPEYESVGTVTPTGAWYDLDVDDVFLKFYWAL